MRKNTTIARKSKKGRGVGNLFKLGKQLIETPGNLLVGAFDPQNWKKLFGGNKYGGACWENYMQKGYKYKGNKTVPNCVPIGGGKKSKRSKRKGGFLEVLIPTIAGIGLNAMLEPDS
jgi:hypothetical protein